MDVLTYVSTYVDIQLQVAIRFIYQVSSRNLNQMIQVSFPQVLIQYIAWYLENLKH